jgi:hypothetical protein
MPDETLKPKKPRKKKPKESVEFAGRKDGVMKLFKTEEEAFEYAEANSSIAAYKTTNGSDFEFVKLVGIKTSAGKIGKILQGM